MTDQRIEPSAVLVNDRYPIGDENECEKRAQKEKKRRTENRSTVLESVKNTRR